jgi:hypothetical protein
MVDQIEHHFLSDTGTVHRHAGLLSECEHPECVQQHLKLLNRYAQARYAGRPVGDPFLVRSFAVWLITMTGPWIVLLWGLDSWRSALAADLLATLAMIFVLAQQSTKQR